MLETSILFVDEANNGRSILAEAYFNHLSGQAARAFSAGFAPDDVMSRKLFDVLREEGMSPEDYCPKPIDIFLQSYSPRIDLVVGFEPSDKDHKLPLFPNRPQRITLNVSKTGGVDAPLGSRQALRACLADMRLVIDRAIALGQLPGALAA